MATERNEERVFVTKRLEAIEGQIVGKAEVSKIKRYIRIMQNEFMSKVSKIEEVFSSGNKANYFATIFKRLGDLEGYVHDREEPPTTERSSEPIEKLESRISELEQDRLRIEELKHSLGETMWKVQALESAEHTVPHTPEKSEQKLTATPAQVIYSVGKRQVQAPFSPPERQGQELSHITPDMKMAQPSLTEHELESMLENENEL